MSVIHICSAKGWLASGGEAISHCLATAWLHSKHTDITRRPTIFVDKEAIHAPFVDKPLRSSGQMCIRYSCLAVSVTCLSQWPSRLRQGSAADRFLGLRSRIPPGSGISASLGVVCYQAQGSATGRSFVQRSPTNLGVFKQMWLRKQTWEDLDLRGLLNYEKNTEVLSGDWRQLHNGELHERCIENHYYHSQIKEDTMQEKRPSCWFGVTIFGRWFMRPNNKHVPPERQNSKFYV